ncbi:MAG: hypothetical protein NC543_04990 [bacterium]|nr:hypothetical protein [bacterium]MCM1374895.1 hypothetical protein [Muribaculum sp.]
MPTCRRLRRERLSMSGRAMWCCTMIRRRNCGVRWKEKLKKNRWQLAVLVLVLLVQCFNISQKDGYHMDELLTFELANAEYNPWIVPTQPVGRLAKFMQQEIYEDSLGATLGNLWDTVVDVLQNGRSSKLLSYRADVYEQPVWISREQFHDYITVGKRDGFNYLSVYFNVKDDNHPPLYFMLVHTMSSIFRGRISPWMGCVFNLAAVLGCCVLMFAMGRLLAACRCVEERMGERWGLCSALLYGCSAGAIATSLFIRMYGLMTLLCMLTLYLHLQKWLGTQKDFTHKNKLLILVTALGFWTQYFFLFYCLLLALVTVIALLRGGRKKEALCYIRSMGIAAVIGVGVYPFGVKHILASGRGVEAIDNLLSGLSGYGERVLSFGRILLQRTLGMHPLGAVAVAILIGIGVLLRIVDRRGSASRTAGLDGRERRGLRWLLALPPAGYFLLAARMSPYMVDRYIMPVFPFAAMAVAALLLYLWNRSGRRGAGCVMAVLLALACFSGITYARYDGEYLYSGYDSDVSGQLGIGEQYADLPCICIYEGYSFYDNLLEFQMYERTLLVKPSELAGRQDIAELSEAIILRKGNVDSEAWREVQELLADYGLERKFWLVRGSVYGDEVAYYGSADARVDRNR